VIIVDTSVWIDYFNGVTGQEPDLLDRLLGEVPIGIGDIILVEVLQGFRSDRDYRRAQDLLSSLTILDMLGAEAAYRCAAKYRDLRKKGITIRKTADVIIASFCIAGSHALLYSDRDLDPFVEHLGLIAVS
jgi:predicted nucleic acid-binding protein